MRKIIYILISAALLCSCEEFYGSFDDASQEFVEIVAINRSSIPVKLNISGAYWVEPQDTIYLKANNGLWKTEESRENYYGQDILPLVYSVVRAEFNDGEHVVYFDEFSDIPHNPCEWGAKEVWDDMKQHKIIEFSDKICEDIFAYQETLHAFNISMNFSPSDVVESLAESGSTEGYFSSLYPTANVQEKLKLGSVVYAEAETIDQVRFAEGLKYEADTVATTTDSICRYHPREIYSYYDLDQLRKFGLTNFGCDFAALVPRADGKFESYCGVALLKVQVAKSEKILDREHPEDFVAALENMSEPVCVVDKIEYGNFMLLLAEADCSHENIHNYIQTKLFREEPEDYYAYGDYYTPEIRFHLITLDDDGSFVCMSGGKELAATFYEGYETPALHPLSFHLTSLRDYFGRVHVKGI